MSEKTRKKGVFTYNLSSIFCPIFAKIGRTEPQKVAPKQSKELSVNSGTKVTQPGTWDARRQFRDGGSPSAAKFCDSFSPYYKRLKILKFTDLYKLEVGKFIYVNF